MITIELSSASYPSYSELIESLVDYDYHHVGMVMEPGEYAVRGSIIDVFPSNHSHPVRFDYFGNDLDRLTVFDVASQQSLRELSQTQIKKRTRSSSVNAVTSLTDAVGRVTSQFNYGDLVVHEQFGIGQFSGLKRLCIDGQEGEYVFLKYRGEDRLYVPLHNLNRLHPFSKNDELTQLSQLHDGSWEKAKAKVEKATEKLAEEIFELYKKRAHVVGFQYGEDTEDQLVLESGFEHPLTPDQERAVREIKADMETPRPMDRLLCGDVGYGKTEVLLRAAFKALENYKQVVLLVPTTILAEQHFKTILKRFSTFPYQVVCLSRFQSKVEQQAILKRVKCQQVDMIIGTHRLLQKDVTFKDLGLVIVDEEQRFGVKDKEKLKTFVATVDVLSVSATPIPRTMYMALTGTRDFSVIGTPPKMKKEVRTVLGPFDEQAVKQAILKEKNRKGQVFYVHNRVDSILSIQSRLSVLLPETTIDVVHGQLPELEIQRRLQAFYAHKTDVLIATTIIENGIDFPNANTLIIDQAEQLGVSQIHQLRGRVGRSNTQGLAYIFYSPSKTLTEKSKARLQAIKEYASLGSGYQLAVKDLEIRGAGNLLGREQSGHVLTVGFNLYCHLLEAAIFRAKGEERRTQGWLNIPAQEFFVEDTYIASDRERLAVYQRVQTLQCLEDCSKLQSELEDRYGVMSIAMKGRFSRVEERLKAK